MPTISPLSLLPQDRIPRRPLPAWSAELRVILEQAAVARRPLERCSLMAGAANNAALIASYVGDVATARELCELQACWQVRTARRAHAPSLSGLAVQPWVNLGRLDVLEGDWSTALARFQDLRQYQRGRPMILGATCIASDAWRSLHTTEEAFEEFLELVFVMDSLRALFLTKQYYAAVEMARALEATASERMQPFVQEGRIVAASMTGDHDTAIHVARAAAGRMSAWWRAAFQLRLIEATARAGHLDRARASATALARTLAGITPAIWRRAQPLQTLLRVAVVCAELDLDEAAVDAARAAVAGARALDDEGVEIEALRVIAGSGHADSEDARAELARLEATTWYRKYRRGTTTDAILPSVITDLFAATRDAMDP
jgi:hypothetical protein